MPRSKIFISLSILFLSGLLRIYSIGTESYWIDEMVSLHFAKHPDWRALFWDNSPFLYHLILKGWVAVFGDLEAVTRLLSTIFSVCATATVMRIGFALGGWPTAMATGFVHALSALSITYGQETRMYAMFEFFAALNLFAWIETIQGRARNTLFVVSAVLMMLTHYLAAIPLAVEGVVAAWIFRKQMKFSSLVIKTGVGGFIFVSASCAALFSWKHLYWQNLKFQMEPDARWPIEFLNFLANKSDVAAIALVIAVTWTLVRLFRSKQEQNLVPLLVIFFAPVLLLTASGFIFQRATLLPRYLIFLTPVFAVIVGYVWNENFKTRNVLGTFLFLFFFVGTAVELHSVYDNIKAPWRTAANVISKFPGSIVLTTRSAAVQTPYFENRNVPLKRWDSTKLDVPLIEASSYDYVWIVDTYWSMKEYLPHLLKFINGKVQWTDEIIKDGNQEPLYVLQIKRFD